MVQTSTASESGFSGTSPTASVNGSSGTSPTANESGSSSTFWAYYIPGEVLNSWSSSTWRMCLPDTGASANRRVCPFFSSREAKHRCALDASGSTEHQQGARPKLFLPFELLDDTHQLRQPPLLSLATGLLSSVQLATCLSIAFLPLISSFDL